MNIIVIFVKGCQFKTFGLFENNIMETEFVKTNRKNIYIIIGNGKKIAVK